MAFLGHEVIPFALAHIGEKYVLGARAPVLNPSWKGPWDCAEFATWCSYQAYKIVFGARPKDARTADAYTGYWWEESARLALQVPVAAALASPGAFLLRQPRRDLIGHIAISLGDGRLVEAAGAKLGVIARPNTPDRRWDAGVVLPGVEYAAGQAQPYSPSADVLRVTSPYTRDPRVLCVQRTLAAREYDPGTVDGIYGELTEAAVIALQTDRGLIVDGEVGQQTAVELGLAWPIVASQEDVAAFGAPLDAVLTTARVAPSVALLPPTGQEFQFTFRKLNNQHFAKETSETDEVLIGRDTSYKPSGRSYRGLAHRTSSDLALIEPYGRYNRLREDAHHGIWAHFVWPSVIGESGGLYARLNTYDAGFCTFGIYQLAAHTPGENLAELFRELLKLEEAAAYFADLALVEGKVHRKLEDHMQPLEVAATSQGLDTSALALYLNPDTQQVDEEERLAGARLVHWTRRSAAARSAQVQVCVSIAKRKLQRAHAKVDLSNRSLDQCIWVSDILHQGRGNYARIKSALRSPNPKDELMLIGGFAERIKTVAQCVDQLESEGTIVGKAYEDLWDQQA